MKIQIRFRVAFVTTVRYLFVLLFVYAATSKLLEFNDFRVQLGQSPMLSAFADIFVYLVPLSEYLIVLLLVMAKLRSLGLLLSFSIMVMFTAYISILLVFSPFVPCSCGGVLSEMGWTEHLIFNIVFTLLALLALLAEPTHSIESVQTKIITFSGMFVGSVSLVAGLFIISEDTIHRNNGFVRRFEHHPLTPLKGLSIRYNSYYIAGCEDGMIYLGNVGAPKLLTRIDTALGHISRLRLDIENSNAYTFAGVQVRVKDERFYFADGTVPVIFKGSLSSLSAKMIYRGSQTFSSFEVIDSTRFAIRGSSPKTGMHTLETILIDGKAKVPSHTDLLDSRGDGIFNTDGIMDYNAQSGRLTYVYYYRNGYLNYDPQTDSVQHARTIDTLTEVPLQFAFIKNGSQKKFAQQPEPLQTYATTSGRYLFVKSERLGKYDRAEMLAQSSFIDVYDLTDNTYRFSFYLDHYKGEAVERFRVYGNLLVGLTKKHIVVCRLRTPQFRLSEEKK